MKRTVTGFIAALLLLSHLHLKSQTNAASPTSVRPKLVIGIVVDQMRNDYIHRYWNRFGNGGFKRLVSQGYYFRNAHYNYVPTYTGPGHCSIYTGATPRAHGIIGNDWYMEKSGRSMYCTQDSTAETVGSTSKNGKMSPKNQLSSTIGDELKMSSNQKAKVFAVSLKDRSSILPAGHAANAAFWFDDATGDFISSTWYIKELPEWLRKFNARKLTRTYIEQGWSPLYPLETYTSSLADDTSYEETLGKEKSTFPYDLKKYIEKNKWGIIKSIPAGNTLTTELTTTCLLSENLGKGTETDLLCISYSATDYVGHAFGPRAVETEDVYLRLDKDLETLLNTLDKTLGKNNYVVFLTADHGAADVPAHLLDQKIPAGYIREKQIVKSVKEFFKASYNDTSLFLSISNEQLFLNEEKINTLKLDKEQVETSLCAFLTGIDGIAEAYPSSVLKNSSFGTRDYRSLIQNGYNHKRSGDIAILYQPGWMDHSEKGTTHGAAYNYDTHIPVIFFGGGIKKGESFDYITITQIAPTVCELLKINQPNSCIAEPLNGFFR